MSDITLSAGVRQNLLSLQSTASLLGQTQENLATGKKVNSAADNPSNFFTSQSLNNRANDLSSLLDSIGQAQQTVNQAESGITSLTNLVQSAKSLATQAQQATTGTVNYTAVTGTQAIAADTTELTSSATVASAVGAAGVTASVQSNVSLAAGSFTGGSSSLVNGDTLVFTLGSGTAQTATFTTGTAGANQFTDAASLTTLLNTDFSGKAVATNSSGAVTLTSNDLSNDFTTSGTGVADAGTNLATTAHTLGSALTISDGNGHSANFYYVASTNNVQSTQGEFNTAGDLVRTAISTRASEHPLDDHADRIPAGNLQLDSAAARSPFAAGGLGTAPRLRHHRGQWQLQRDPERQNRHPVGPGRLECHADDHVRQRQRPGKHQGGTDNGAEWPHRHHRQPQLHQRHPVHADQQRGGDDRRRSDARDVARPAQARHHPTPVGAGRLRRTPPGRTCRPSTTTCSRRSTNWPATRPTTASTCSTATTSR